MQLRIQRLFKKLRECVQNLKCGSCKQLKKKMWNSRFSYKKNLIVSVGQKIIK